MRALAKLDRCSATPLGCGTSPRMNLGCRT
jgi:hypothetical protein